MRAKHAAWVLSSLISVLLLVGCQQQQMVRLTKEKYIDKCTGAWAGQMIGVCYAGPYEFRTSGKPDMGPVEWDPAHVYCATGQDDIYVEMTWLQALEKHGLDITYEQAGKTFADSKYGLAHANAFGRFNVRRGIMPPMSGHPSNNRHADDIDFQIEADLLGIICPGLPQESNRLCDIFGHIMNYGDGVYGGMFVAGMYAAAYFEDDDVIKVVRSGLSCIPRRSQYHKCVSDVLKWYRQRPNDWLAVWEQIEQKWNDDLDCVPGNPYNIDAKLNGAYIVMGLLHGQGDPMKTMEIALRCGQDSDCNVSSAMGVLACMKGFEALGDELTRGIRGMAGAKFSHTNYWFTTLIPACRRMTERIIHRVGGQITESDYLIPRQRPKSAAFEQWTDQREVIAQTIPQFEIDLWNPGWKLVACGSKSRPGFKASLYGPRGGLLIHPVSRTEPAVLVKDYSVPAGPSPLFRLEVCAHPEGAFRLKIFCSGQLEVDDIVSGREKWVSQTADLSLHSGERVRVRIEAHSVGAKHGRVCLGKVEIE